MVAYAAWESKKEQLRRKALNGSMFVAPESATALTALTGTDGSLVALPTGYIDAGLIDDSGEVFARAVNKSESTSWGRTQPTRSDVDSDVTTLQLTLQETNKLTLELYTGIDMSTITPDPSSGELKLTKPSTPADRYYRVLCLAVDTTSVGEIYVARFFPRMKVTDYADQAFAKSDTGIVWGVTLTAHEDDTLGTAEVTFYGGPGWKPLLADMGFAAA